MRILYLECNMGAAGDMLMAALTGLFEEPEEIVLKLNKLGIPDTEYKVNDITKAGIKGKQMSVFVCGGQEEGHRKQDHKHHGHHEHGHHNGHVHVHAGLPDIEHIIDSIDASGKVKSDAKAVYRLIAEAESNAHGCPVEQIHFHEVGTMDAIADIVGTCYLLNELKVDKIIASAVRTGYGEVECAHGVLPVPAPATEYLLRGIPVYSGSIKGEMCTPTGAALLKYFVSSFGEMPVLQIEKTGYGMGKKEFETINCVRAMLGNTADAKEQVCVLSCNLDDMTPEAAGFAMEELFKAGALDVYTVPANMKKNRPGILFNCICEPEQREKIIRLMFLHTTTLGIRETICNRYTLERTITTENTPYGKVHVKHASGWGVSRSKPEYEDIAKIAKEKGMSFLQAVDQL
ncbi:MAG TPA: nickel pincer cofactor biosynthesis protein LarC [Lachnospiraceae bacterium]|nr:nickel pincer cofactor biosynthesis protein LarC [Lachnospiraceae bacterium]